MSFISQRRDFGLSGFHLKMRMSRKSTLTQWLESSQGDTGSFNMFALAAVLEANFKHQLAPLGKLSATPQQAFFLGDGLAARE